VVPGFENYRRLDFILFSQQQQNCFSAHTGGKKNVPDAAWVFSMSMFFSLIFVIRLQLHPVDNVGGDHYLAKLSLCCQSVRSLQKRFV
jgi:hypothetical protein